MSIKIHLLLIPLVICVLTGCGVTSTTQNNTHTGIAAEDLFATRQPATNESPGQGPVGPIPPTSTSTTTTPLTTVTTNTPMEFNASKHYNAILHTTQGDIEIALNFGQTPNTVKNFVDLARKNFYNNTIFHRAISGFMIQGGDPEGTGMGGPGYRFNDEPFTGEYTKGTVAMANAGPNTNGSQFFIMHADYPLPKNYTIFGKVIRGIEVVDTIATAKVEYSATGELSKPVSPVTVTSIEIIES